MNLWIRNFENIFEIISSPQMGQIDGEWNHNRSVVGCYFGKAQPFTKHITWNNFHLGLKQKHLYSHEMKLSILWTC